MILSAMEIALIKCLRGKANQLIIVKTKDGEVISVDRIESTKTKDQNNLVISMEKKEKLYPV